MPADRQLRQTDSTLVLVLVMGLPTGDHGGSLSLWGPQVHYLDNGWGRGRSERVVMETQLSLGTHRSLVPGPLRIPKSKDAQAPSARQCSIGVSPVRMLLCAANRV